MPLDRNVLASINVSDTRFFAVHQPREESGKIRKLAVADQRVQRTSGSGTRPATGSLKMPVETGSPFRITSFARSIAPQFFHSSKTNFRNVFRRGLSARCRDHGDDGVDFMVFSFVHFSSNAITWPSGSRANSPLKPKFLSLSVTTPGETNGEFSASNRFANESAVLTIRVVCQ